MSSTSAAECIACRRPKGALECGLCHESVCRNCATYQPEGTFSFFTVVPAELAHTHYCPTCYDEQVAPQKLRYDSLMEQARETAIFFTTQRRQLPILKKTNDVLKVVDCADRDETILRLAFQAAQMECNSVIEVEVEAEKVRNFGYQKSAWRGQGRPAQVDIGKVERWAGNKDQLRLGRPLH